LASLRARVQAKLLRRRREAATISPEKPRTSVAEIDVSLPAIDWHGLEPESPQVLEIGPVDAGNGVSGFAAADACAIEGADPFRASGVSLLPELTPASPLGSEAEPASRLSLRKPTTPFRWSALSQDLQTPVKEVEVRVRKTSSPASLESVRARLRRGSQALLRRSQYSLRARLSRASVLPEPPLGAREGEPVGLGAGVRRMGRGIGFTRAAPVVPMSMVADVQVYAPADFEDGLAAQGCYAGFRHRKGARAVIEVESGMGVGQDIPSRTMASGTI